MFFLIGLDWDLMRLSYSVISIYIYVIILECDWGFLDNGGEGATSVEEKEEGKGGIRFIF